MDWWNVLVFGVTPVLTVILLFCVKRKYLWCTYYFNNLSVIISLIAMPTILDDGEAANMFFELVVPMHFLITLILVAITYGVSFILKKKYQDNKN